MLISKTKEQRTCTDVVNLPEREAISIIKERGFVAHVFARDREEFPRKDPCYISSRINLKIYKGKVISAQVG